MSRAIGLLVYDSHESTYCSYCLRCYTEDTMWFKCALESPNIGWPISEDQIGPFGLMCFYCNYVFWGQKDLVLFKRGRVEKSPEIMANGNFPSRIPDMDNAFIPAARYEEYEENGCTCTDCRMFRGEE
jgi:hypothetical protein